MALVERLCEVVALGRVAVHLPQQVCLVPALHTLGDGFHAQGVGKLYHHPHYRRVRDVLTQALDERLVYLDSVGGASLVAETAVSRRLAAMR